MQQDEQNSTHFGYQRVTEQEKTTKVNKVFDSVAQRYDLMNDLMSAGVHRLWKRIAVSYCQLAPHYQVLDLAGGTADLACLLGKKLSNPGQLTIADINENMLSIGRDKLINQGLCHIVNAVTADAGCLPFASNKFHLLTISFGLRNVTKQQIALNEMQRVLRPGGQLLILEFSHPESRLLKKIYDKYSFSVLPWLGGKIVNDKASYQYLAESIRMHPKQKQLQHNMEQAGFERCRYHNIHSGLVAIHIGYKL